MLGKSDSSNSALLPRFRFPKAWAFFSGGSNGGRSFRSRLVPSEPPAGWSEGPSACPLRPQLRPQLQDGPRESRRYHRDHCIRAGSSEAEMPQSGADDSSALQCLFGGPTKSTSAPSWSLCAWAPLGLCHSSNEINHVAAQRMLRLCPRTSKYTIDLVAECFSIAGKLRMKNSMSACCG